MILRDVLTIGSNQVILVYLCTIIKTVSVHLLSLISLTPLEATGSSHEQLLPFSSNWIRC
jgi:hypothetical protein